MNSNIILLAVCWFIIGGAFSIWACLKLLKYGIKNMTLDEFKAHLDKSLKDNGAELQIFNFNKEDKVLDIKIGLKVNE